MKKATLDVFYNFQIRWVANFFMIEDIKLC